MLRLILAGLFVLVLILPMGAPKESSAAAKAGTTADRVFELRTYYTNEGKLDDLHKRFRDHTSRSLEEARRRADWLLDAARRKGRQGRKARLPGGFPQP